jgi:hypothetical protein
MWRFKRSDRGNRVQPFRGEIDKDARKTNISRYCRGEQRLLKPIGLRLHTINQHADYIMSIYATSFEDMPGRRVLALARIGRRKYLVAYSASGLQAATTANSRIRPN